MIASFVWSLAFRESLGTVDWLSWSVVLLLGVPPLRRLLLELRCYLNRRYYRRKYPSVSFLPPAERGDWLWRLYKRCFRAFADLGFSLYILLVPGLLYGWIFPFCCHRLPRILEEHVAPLPREIFQFLGDCFRRPTYPESPELSRPPPPPASILRRSSVSSHQPTHSVNFDFHSTGDVKLMRYYFNPKTKPADRAMATPSRTPPSPHGNSSPLDLPKPRRLASDDDESSDHTRAATLQAPVPQVPGQQQPPPDPQDQLLPVPTLPPAVHMNRPALPPSKFHVKRSRGWYQDLKRRKRQALMESTAAAENTHNTLGAAIPAVAGGKSLATDTTADTGSAPTTATGTGATVPFQFGAARAAKDPVVPLHQGPAEATSAVPKDVAAPFQFGTASEASSSSTAPKAPAAPAVPFQFGATGTSSSASPAPKDAPAPAVPFQFGASGTASSAPKDPAVPFQFGASPGPSASAGPQPAFQFGSTPANTPAPGPVTLQGTQQATFQFGSTTATTDSASTATTQFGSASAGGFQFGK